MQEIETKIRNEQDFLIIGHISPDGDTIGSGMALLLALKSLGKSAIFVVDGKVPEKLAFLEQYAPIYTPESCPKQEFGCVIAVDVSDKGRMGKAQALFDANDNTVVIDHHGTNPAFGAVNYIETVGAAGLLIYQLIQKLQVPITKQIADLLYIALCTDTGNFSYSNYDGVPQDAYPDALPEYIKEMEQNGWDRGEDDEELFELAMHDRQYRDYKSGVAKDRFYKEMEKLRAERNTAPSAPAAEPGTMPNYMKERYRNATPVVATATGQVLWEVDFDDRSIAPAPGREYKAGDMFCHIQASYAIMPVTLTVGGRLVDTCVPQGAMVKKGDTIGWIEPQA